MMSFYHSVLKTLILTPLVNFLQAAFNLRTRPRKSAERKGSMPGSSLWLVPPEESDLYNTLHALILKEIPSLYQDASTTSSTATSPPPAFTPHVTLTADTVLAADSTAAADPQAWLDSLTIPIPRSSAPLKVTLQNCDAGQIFFRKLTLLCERTAPLADLAAHSRAARRGGDEARPAGETVAEAAAWIAENYTPHLSLM